MQVDKMFPQINVFLAQNRIGLQENNRISFKESETRMGQLNEIQICSSASAK